MTPSRLPRTLLLPPASHTGHQYKITKLKNYIQPQKLVCKQIYVLMLRLEAAAWGGTASSAVEAAPWVAIPCIPDQNNMTRHTIYHLLSTGCPVKLSALRFCYFLGFQSTYRRTSGHFSIAQEMRISKLTLLSFLCEKLI